MRRPFQRMAILVVTSILLLAPAGMASAATARTGSSPSTTASTDLSAARLTAKPGFHPDSPGGCGFNPITLNDRPIASFGRCDSGNGQYAALVYCNGYKYSVTGDWENAGSGVNSYAWCKTNVFGTPDTADFVGYTWRV